MLENNYKFSYTITNLLPWDKKLKKIRIPLKINFEQFVKNTSIATSTMMIEK